MVEQEPQRSIKGIKIEGVPFLKQKRLWCGITSLAMQIQHRGLEVSPERVFEGVNGVGSYNYVTKTYSEKPSPAMGHLADLVEELTDGQLVPHLFTESTHRALAQKNPRKLATPGDVMQYFLLGENPCMIRTPGHFSVVTGFDLEGGRDGKGIYFVNDPFGNEPRTEDMADLESRWGAEESNLYIADPLEREAALREIYPENPRFQMLIVRPVKKS